MRSLRYVPVLVLLTFTCFSAALTPKQAQLKFPSENPTFSLALPSGWTAKPDKSGNLDCDPGDDSGYSFSIILLEQVTSQDQLKALLPEIAKKMAEGAKIKNLELGDVDSTKNENGVPFIGIRGDGKSEGTEFVLVMQGFEPQKGKFYAILTASSAKADDKHEKDYDAIYDSIKPIEP